MALDSREVLRAYRDSSELRAVLDVFARPEAEVGGLWGASLAFVLAAWKAREEPSTGPCLVVASNQEEADQLVEELGVFSQLPVHALPAWESLFLQDSVPDGDIYQQRLDVLVGLIAAANEPTPASSEFFVVAPVQALLQPVPPPEELTSSKLSLCVDEEFPPQELSRRLVAAGFRNVSLVERRGDFSQRGDRFDLFPYQGDHPLRLEFFGDTLESMREFRAENQRSIKESETKSIDLYLLSREAFFRDCFRGDEDHLATDYLRGRGTIVYKEPEAIQERAEKVLHNLLGDDRTAVQFTERLEQLRGLRVRNLPTEAAQGLNLDFRSVEGFRQHDLAAVCANLSARLEAGTRLEIYCENEAEAKRFDEILQDHDLRDANSGGAKSRGRLAVCIGPLRHGFEVTSLGVVFLTTRELFNRRTVRRLRKKRVPTRPIQSFLELSRGDYVVHVGHGVSRYLGMECLEKDGVEQEFLVLEFRNALKLYVPVSKTDLVQKFIGGGDKPPRVDKLGGSTWAKKKEDVERALFDLASELVEIQAARLEKPGIPYPPDSEWQREFEAAFPFEDTPDQVEVTEAIKADMCSSRPMDRLVCGDVGYGKTELAMRAAFKTVDGGKQVAILVPTTLLAQQHFRTFSERMAEFPVTIDVLSRFRTSRQQRATLEATAEGKVDILIGTHRILSDDVAFSDLGLVVIDEEQRFGVAHKEKLKKLRSLVEILTLSATPIPRTLHMSLLGIRDISNLTTAPEGRNSVSTELAHYDPNHVREAFLRELNRDGQIYFVHNRVHDILHVKSELERLVPEARIEYGHGQMHEHELEERMFRFVEGDADVLISTTIIESGIDIPNVNTIFIDQADRYGLADLHQLRGRVGRYKHQAYCYLLLPRDRPVRPEAMKRLRALVEFSNLGAGFQIALRDLEIRGAGNLLGAAQSGHIALVGYDMYCRLLEQAVRKLKQEDAAEPVQVEVDFALQAFFPEDYVPGEPAKLELYRRISQTREADTIPELRDEIRDRFGPLPAQVEQLLDIQVLRVNCARHGVEYVGRDEQHLLLRGGEKMKEVLSQCSARVVVLDARTAAVALGDTRRRPAPIVDDEYAFLVALEWFQTGKFPSGRIRKRQAAKNRSVRATR